jgi:hypothetical protein
VRVTALVVGTWTGERNAAMGFALSIGHVPKTVFEETDRVAFQYIEADEVDKAISVTEALIKEIENRALPVATANVFTPRRTERGWSSCSTCSEF